MNSPELLPKILGRKYPIYENTSIKSYDFKRPDKFSRPQIQTMCILHESFCRKLTTTLDSLLNLSIQAGVGCVDQMTFEEALETAPACTSYSILSPHPMPGTMILYFDEMFHERVLNTIGGWDWESPQGRFEIPQTRTGQKPHEQVDSTNHRRNRMSELENTILTRVNQDIGYTLEQTWWFLEKPHFQVESLEDNPKYCQIVPPVEMVVTVDITLSIGPQQMPGGSIRLIYPYLTLEPIIGKLDPLWWYTQLNKKKESDNRNITNLLPVETRIQIPFPAMNLRQLENLTPGTRISIPLKQAHLLHLKAGGAPICGARWLEVSDTLPLNIQTMDLTNPWQVPGLDSDDTPSEVLDPKQLTDSIIRELTSVLNKTLEKSETLHKGSVSNLGDFATGQAHGGTSMQNKSHGHPGQNPRELETDLIFEHLTVDQGESIFTILRDEPVQLQAAIISQLSPPLAADILSRARDKEQPEILAWIADMKKIPGFVLKISSVYLDQQLNFRANTRGYSGDGFQKAVEILNYVPREVERNVINTWDSIRPGLSETTKQHLFVFEDIVLLSPPTLEKLLKTADEGDFAMALKTLTPELSGFLEQALGAKRIDAILSQSASLGPVRTKDVDAARSRIINRLKELDEAGEVVILRPGERVE